MKRRVVLGWSVIALLNLGLARCGGQPVGSNEPQLLPAPSATSLGDECPTCTGPNAAQTEAATATPEDECPTCDGQNSADANAATATPEDACPGCPYTGPQAAQRR
jgi:hypothetical protein